MRTPFINSTEFPYHITNRCINREWFGAPMDEVWTIISEQLYFAAQAFSLEIHAFVLMGNHYHMIVRSPEANLSTAINHFQAESAKRIVKTTHRIHHLWARRFKRCLISTNTYYMNAYKYLHRNPIEAGLCSKVEDYKYNALLGLLGQERLYFPVFDDCLFDDPEGVLHWLNTPVEPIFLDHVRRALRRNDFTLPRLLGKVHPLETTVI